VPLVQDSEDQEAGRQPSDRSEDELRRRDIADQLVMIQVVGRDPTRTAARLPSMRSEANWSREMAELQRVTGCLRGFWPPFHDHRITVAANRVRGGRTSTMGQPTCIS
jgi:hypothetical protein